MATRAEGDAKTASSPKAIVNIPFKDCACDSRDRRIAAATDGYRRYPIETGSTNGGRTLVIMCGRRFWVPTCALDDLHSPAMTIYFTPHALFVVNVEPAQHVSVSSRSAVVGTDETTA